MLKILTYLPYLLRSPVPLAAVLVSGTIQAGVVLLSALIGKSIYDRLLVSMDPWLLARVALSLMLILGLNVASTFVAHFARNLLRERITEALRLDFLKKCLGFRYRFFLETESGRLVKIIAEDLSAISQSLCGFATLLALCIQISLGMALFYMVSKWMFLIYLDVISAFLAWYLLWIWPISFTASRIDKAYTSLYEFAGQFHRGVKVLKLLNAWPYASRRWAKAEGMTRRSLFWNTMSHASFWIAAMLPWVAFPIFLAGTVHDIGLGRMTIGHFVVALSFLWALFEPLTSVVEQLGCVQLGIGAARRIAALPGKVRESSGTIALKTVSREIEFSEVSFCYPNGARALENVSLKITAGTKVGIAGLSGSGKTTLISLLMKLHEGYTGRITIDGNELADLETENLRSNIAFLTQEAWVMNETLRRNIDPEGKLTDTEMNDVCQRAGLAELINRLPDRLDSRVLESGSNFSGGERQRIALARCLSRNADVIILDEPTSALDPNTEAAIWKALETETLGKTMVTITHRLTLLEKVDEIFVFDRGVIVQRGNYRDLLADSTGKFALLHASQNAGVS